MPISGLQFLPQKIHKGGYGEKPSGRDQMASELQHAFELAIAKYRKWRSGDEPTVSYQTKDCSISFICNLMTFYESVPLRPGIESF